jgi:hypothetical protein
MNQFCGRASLPESGNAYKESKFLITLRNLIERSRGFGPRDEGSVDKLLLRVL